MKLYQHPSIEEETSCLTSSINQLAPSVFELCIFYVSGFGVQRTKRNNQLRGLKAHSPIWQLVDLTQRLSGSGQNIALAPVAWGSGKGAG